MSFGDEKLLFILYCHFLYFHTSGGSGGGGGGGEFAPKTFFGQLGSENFIMHVCFVLFWFGLVLVIVQKYVYVH